MESVSVKLWGNEMWIAIYAIAIAYPDEPDSNHKTNIIDYFKTLRVLLPCKNCRDHYTTFMNEDKIESNISSKDELCKWVNRIHNSINKKLNKKLISLSSVKKYFYGLGDNPFLTNYVVQPRKTIKKCKKGC